MLILNQRYFFSDAANVMSIVIFYLKNMNFPKVNEKPLNSLIMQWPNPLSYDRTSAFFFLLHNFSAIIIGDK